MIRTLNVGKIIVKFWKLWGCRSWREPGGTWFISIVGLLGGVL